MFPLDTRDPFLCEDYFSVALEKEVLYWCKPCFSEPYCMTVLHVGAEDRDWGACFKLKIFVWLNDHVAPTIPIPHTSNEKLYLLAALVGGEGGYDKTSISWCSSVYIVWEMPVKTHVCFVGFFKKCLHRLEFFCCDGGDCHRVCYHHEENPIVRKVYVRPCEIAFVFCCGPFFIWVCLNIFSADIS